MRLHSLIDLNLITSNNNTPYDPQPMTLQTIDNQLSVCFLEADIARVTFRPGAPNWRLDRTWMIVDSNGNIPREGRSRADLSRYTRPAPTPHAPNTLTTSALTVTADAATGTLNWSNADGTTFAADLPRRAYTYDTAGTLIQHYMHLRDDACFYGFGERAGPLNKRGLRMEMRNLDAFGYSARHTDPLYKHYPLYITFLPSLNVAYGLLYDNLATTLFDMGREIDAIWGPYTKYEAHNGDLDYYLLYGPTIEDVIEKIAWLTGKPFMPPRYTLGYLGSTMSYTDAPNAQEQLKQFVELIHRHDIPCDGFHLSSGYTTNADGVRNVFTWNNDRVPDPTTMVQTFHDAHIKLLPNVKPYVLDASPHYPAQLRDGGVIRNADGSPYIARFWSGGAYESTNGVYLDFSSPAGYDWWQSQLKAQLFAYGMDAIWNDNNEYEIWDDEAVCNGYGQPIPIGMARPLQALLMAHASYHATVDHAPDKRPFVLSRSGCPGLQRYAQTWSGDNTTSWESLQYNIPMGLGMGLSGTPNIGHDIGGFHGPRPTPELFVRWVQNGIFHPRFTIHSWNSDATVNEPWMYPQVLQHVRAAIDFRYRLLPYLYSLFRESHQTGRPIIRPTVYHYPKDPNTHNQSFEFMLGANLLVATVLEQGARTRDVYLPAETSWTDFFTFNRYEGGQTITVEAPLDRFPLFVPDGGLIPLGKRRSSTVTEPDDVRIYHAFPHPTHGETAFTLYEDDGVAPIEPQMAHTSVRVVLQTTDIEIKITVEVQFSGYQLPYSHIQLILPPGEERSINVPGRDWSESGTVERRHVSIPL